MAESYPSVVERFLRYVQIDTQSDPASKAVPSTEKQKDLSRLLVDELTAMGISDAHMDGYGYVFATLPGSGTGSGGPVLGLFAHVDTAPDAPGNGVNPLVHPAYDGGIIALPGDPMVTIDPERQPGLLDHIGEDLITSDGTTLLGSDDKAGVAVLMQLAADWSALKAVAPDLSDVRLCFTVDEEIGRGVDHLDMDHLAADVGYTVDGSSTDTISYETFHAASAHVQIRGVGVHPGYARGVLTNPVRIVSEIVAALPAGESPEHTDGLEGFFHPHTMEAGGADRAGVQIILRDFDAEGLERRKTLVTQVVEAARTRYPRAEIELTISDQYRNMRSYIQASDARAVTFAIAAASEIGIDLKAERVRGGTDGSRLSERGLPTPNIFNGGYDYHSCFEWNTVQSLERTLVYVKKLVAYWGTNGGDESDRSVLLP